MESTTNSPSILNPMMSISHSIITGGNFKQHHGDEHVHHIYDNRQFHVQGVKGGIEYLKEAVAPGAFHNSGERFDPPKCHPNTRVAVIEKIMDWILGQDAETRDALIMWLHGAAGSGKSAIAQSLAELCYAKGHLLASFFFGRSDPNRNHARSLFPTIAYQMALSIPQLRERLAAIVKYDPLIFTRSLSTQFLSLIAEPLQDLIVSGIINASSIPRLIVLDGLDECLDRQVQCLILDIILDGVQQYHLPLIFLIASRPEHDISIKFNSSEMASVLTCLPLDDSYLPFCDIELFLRDKFKDMTRNHPFKRFIPTPWPTDDNIQSLVRKSSGQFIYASTAVKYVQSKRHRPPHRLEVILDIRPAQRDLPFSELDALYTHLLSSVDEIDQVLSIISFHLLNEDARVYKIEWILSLEPSDIEILLCDLGSVISLPNGRIRILHASLSDFLYDQSRSKEFYVDIKLHCTKHVCKCFQFLTYVPFTDDELIYKAYCFAMEVICLHCRDCLPLAELRDSILNFSIARIYEEATSLVDKTSWVSFMETLVNCFNRDFLPMFFRFLKSGLHFEDAESLHAYHSLAFYEVLTHHLKAYYADKRLTLTIALIKFLSGHPKHGYYPLHAPFWLIDLDLDLIKVDYQHLYLLRDQSHSNWDYFNHISEFLEHPSLLGPYTLDGGKYASAAVCVLSYLCNHLSAPQTIPPKHTEHERLMRRNTPWLWLRKTGRRGRHDKTSFWAKKQEKLLYSDYTDTYYKHWESRDPSINQRLWSEKYYLGLEYLLYFLPRAGRSKELIDFCGQRTFASRSQQSPNRSKKARGAITEYLERMESGEDSE